MAMVLISKTQDGAKWRRIMAELAPDIDFRVWPDVGAPEDIEMAITWKHPPGALTGFANLKCICSLGQGVDHLFLDPELPVGVPIVRLVDSSMKRQMSAFVLAAVLRHHTHAAGYARLQAERRWQALAAADPADLCVGVMGLGALGSDLAVKLVALNFKVMGWSRGPKALREVESFVGDASLNEFLVHCDIVCCLLPLTTDTRDILDARRLAAMKKGAYLINTARGPHVDEAALIEALDDGHLAGAALDVFRQEPLPADNPLWRHPKVTVTPHVSAVTVATSSAPQIVDNYRRLRAGKPLLNLIDRERQY